MLYFFWPKFERDVKGLVHAFFLIFSRNLEIYKGINPCFIFFGQNLEKCKGIGACFMFFGQNLDKCKGVSSCIFQFLPQFKKGVNPCVF